MFSSLAPNPQDFSTGTFITNKLTLTIVVILKCLQHDDFFLEEIF